MIQPRRASAWLLLCVLACLFVLSMASPRLWDHAARSPAKPDSLGGPTASLPQGDGRPSGSCRQASGKSRRGQQRSFECAFGPLPSASRPACRRCCQPDSRRRRNRIAWPHGRDRFGVSARGRGNALAAHASGRRCRWTGHRGPGVGNAGGQDRSPRRPSRRRKRRLRNPRIRPPPAAPESIRRLPMVVANIPSPIRATPHEDVQPPKNGPSPDANQPQFLSQPPASQRQRAERNADDAWRDPETLLESLSGLAAAGPTSKWATEVVRQIRALGLAVTGGSDESAAILERLAELDCQAPQLAAKIADKTLARKLKKVGFALGRRIDVWQEVVRLGVPQPVDSVTPEVDPQKLALCLAEIDSLTGDSPEGQAVAGVSAGRRLETGGQAAAVVGRSRDARDRATGVGPTHADAADAPAAEVRHHRAGGGLAGGTAALGGRAGRRRRGAPRHRELRADRPAQRRPPAGPRLPEPHPLSDRRPPSTGRPGRPALPQRQLAHRRDRGVDQQADSRAGDRVRRRGRDGVGVSRAGRKRDGAPKWRCGCCPIRSGCGWRWKCRGAISADTTADAGPAQFHNDSESYYVARKPLEIDMNGISVWPVEVGVENQTQLRGVSTPLDAHSAARGGAPAGWPSRNRSRADRRPREEVKQKIADQARAARRRRGPQTLDRVRGPHEPTGVRSVERACRWIRR